jgi:hypothetical protein
MMDRDPVATVAGMRPATVITIVLLLLLLVVAAVAFVIRLQSAT